MGCVANVQRQEHAATIIVDRIWDEGAVYMKYFYAAGFSARCSLITNHKVFRAFIVVLIIRITYLISCKES